MSSYPNSFYSTRHGQGRGESAGNTPRATTWPLGPEQRHQVPVRTTQAPSTAAGTGIGGSYHQPPAANIQYPSYLYHQQQSRRSSGSESVSSHGTNYGSAVPADLRLPGGPVSLSAEEEERARRIRQEQSERALRAVQFAPSYPCTAHRGRGTNEAIDAVDRLFARSSMRAPNARTSEFIDELDFITAANPNGNNP